MASSSTLALHKYDEINRVLVEKYQPVKKSAIKLSALFNEASSEDTVFSQDSYEKVHKTYSKFRAAYHELTAFLRVECINSLTREGAVDPIFDGAIRKLMQLKNLRQDMRDKMKPFLTGPQTFSILSPDEVLQQFKSCQALYEKFKERYKGQSEGGDYVEYQRVYFALKAKLIGLNKVLPPEDPRHLVIDKLLCNIVELHRCLPSLEQRALPPMTLKIKPETLVQVQADLPAIFARKKNKETKKWEGPCLPGYTYYNSQSSHRVFSLDSEPNIIFKIQAEGNEDSMRQRIKNVRIGRLVCKKKKFKSLKVPKAELHMMTFEGRSIQVMAEQKLDLHPFQVSKTAYKYAAATLPTLIEELTRFICLTLYSDVAVRNIPLYQGRTALRAALIDLEEFGGSRLGIYGGVYGPRRFKRKGLVEIVGGDTQIASIKALAMNYGVKDPKEAVPTPASAT
jgi:uncharacterized protein YeaO (DUF488 family)